MIIIDIDNLEIPLSYKPNTPGWKQIFNQMNCPLKRPMGGYHSKRKKKVVLLCCDPPLKVVKPQFLDAIASLDLGQF